MAINRIKSWYMEKRKDSFPCTAAEATIALVRASCAVRHDSRLARNGTCVRACSLLVRTPTSTSSVAARIVVIARTSAIVASAAASIVTRITITVAPVIAAALVAIVAAAPPI